ncbi:MAG: DNA-3-methyladenine glycosylase 2 family protein [Bacteroidota bacterium]
MIEQAIIHLKQDQQLKSIIESVDLDYHWHPGETGDVYLKLMSSIIGQQVSVKAAEAIEQRFLNLFEDCYPHAAQVLAFDLETLRGASLSRQKATYVQNVAQYFTENQLFNADWSTWSDEEIMKNLTAIKGIGEWTVQMNLMFCLNRGDVLPVKDLAIQNTMKRLYDLEETGRHLMRKMQEIGAAWRPYRTLACYYLWSWKHRW